MWHTRWWPRIAIIVLVLGVCGSEGQAAVRRVPQSYTTIQAAINAAANGDMVLVSRGTYAGGLVISGKTITLASEYINTGDPRDITQTVVTGGNPLIRINPTAVGTTVRGISFKGGGYGLVNYAPHMNILDNRFIDTQDGVSFESAGGICRGNYFEDSSDDGIDVDYPDFDITIEDNTILNSGNDGIEIRLLPYTGPKSNIVIRSNHISGSVEDGIQLIDYAGLSNHEFRIERNTIVDNAMAGLGCMANGNTNENFAGAPLIEEVQVVNNVFSGNASGITGGDKMLVMNNIIANSAQVGLKRVSASSTASHNDFWNNGTDFTTSNLNTASTIFLNPLLDADYRPQPGSPCLDIGAVSLLWNGETVYAPPFNGPAPDLGAKEVFASSPGRSSGLVVGKSPGGVNLDLAWDPGCVFATDYGIYEGAIGVWYSHVLVQCSTGGNPSATITPGEGNRYLLIVPNNSTSEGSYGADSSDRERPAATNGCRSIQHGSPCP